MKDVFALGVLTLFAASCGGGLTNVVVSNNAVAKPAATVSSKTETPAVPEHTPQAGIIATLRAAHGKYPYELKLLENAEMKSRLRKLLGVDFAAMRANWNVETPIQIESDILMTSGCEQHNCGNNIYYMFVDLSGNNINVYHVKNGRQLYSEGPRIDLPKKLADEMAGDENN